MPKAVFPPAAIPNAILSFSKSDEITRGLESNEYRVLGTFNGEEPDGEEDKERRWSVWEDLRVKSCRVRSKILTRTQSPKECEGEVED